jgi:hypothetical protein
LLIVIMCCCLLDILGYILVILLIGTNATGYIIPAPAFVNRNLVSK